MINKNPEVSGGVLNIAQAIGILQATAESTLRTVEEVRTAVNDNIKASRSRDEALEVRVAALERSRAWLLGAAAGVGFVASKLGNFFHIPGTP